MAGFKILIDTNVVIGLEDARPVEESFAEIARLSSEHKVELFIDSATYDDVARDQNLTRRAITLSKLAKFQKLRGIAARPEAMLIARFGPVNSDNDRSDVRLLAAVDAAAIDFLVTQDNDLRRRAARAGLAAKVLTVEETLEWLRQTFQEKPVELPYVVEEKAYQLDQADPIFSSLKVDYPAFDPWFEKCRKEHRDCWVLKVRDETAGLVIRKDETHDEAGTRNTGSKILKVCTLKVRDEFRGEKFGELLLKQILWFAQRNSYDLVYLTVFPKHTFLIDFLSYYGFQETKHLPSGELLLEKVIANRALPILTGDVLEYDRVHYPRFYDGPLAQKFIAPIQPDYHRKLFPEIAFGIELPLFPNQKLALSLGQDRTPGNTIRKVYLCRAQTKQMRAGDVIIFYMSKDERYAGSQSITTVGIIEQISEITTTEDLVRATAKRSVFSVSELDSITSSSDVPVKVIDFLLIGHSESPINLQTLLAANILKAAPQSITKLEEDRYLLLRGCLNLGFEL